MAGKKPPRRLERRHLPYVVQRRGWAVLVTALLVPPLLCAGLSALWFLIMADTPIGARIGLLPAGCILLLAAILGLDRSFGYHLRIEVDGIRICGLLSRRFFRWSEIQHFDARPNYRLPGYYASFTVDGSLHPRRHWSSLWFGFYDIAPLMLLGGKELTRLLRHAKRRADSGWPEAPPANKRKCT